MALKGSRQQISDFFEIDEALIDNSSDLIQVFTLDEIPVFFNKAWKKTFKYAEDEIPQLLLRDIIHPDYAFKTFEYIRRTIDGEDLGAFDTVLLSREGDDVYVHGRIYCNFRDGTPVACTGVFRDQTEKIKAQRLQKLYYNIAKLGSRAESLEVLLEKIHDHLKESIGAENFYMAQLDQKRGVFNYPYYVDEVFGGKVIDYQRGVGTGLIEYALTRKSPVFLHERDIMKLAKEGKANPLGPVPKMWLGAPVSVANQVEGLIVIKSHTQHLKYTLGDLELLDFIASQVGLLIERRRRIDEVSENRAKLNSIFDSGSHLIWSISKQRGLTSFNKNYANAIEALYGQEPEIDPDGMKPRLLLSAPEHHSLVSDRYDKAFKGETQHFETRHTDKNDQLVWREIFLNPIFLPNGSIEEVSGISHDITDKKQATLALQESEEQFRDIFESFQDLYIRIDLKGKLKLVSPSITEMAGYSQKEVIGKDVRKFFETSIDLRSLIDDLLKEGKISNFEANIRRKDGTTFPSLANIRVIEGEDSEAIEIDGVVRDITVLKKASTELIQAKELAERSLRVKENFLANMSHEIRTPMNGVIAMIDLMKRTTLDDVQQEYVQTISKSSKILLNILNDILDLSKLEAGKMELRPDPIKLSDSVEKIYFLFRQQAESKGINIKWDIAENVPDFIIADETRLIQVLSNLTSNSIKFTNKGDISISVTKERSKGKDLFLRFEVRDTGIGISPENIKVLFQDFTQIQNAITKSYGGTGLGLSISKALCKIMGGKIGVNSKLGDGSAFWFTIKTQETSEVAIEEEDASDTVGPVFADQKPHILLVDDNSVNLKVAKIILENSGCTVVTAENGVEAIECVKSEKPFQVILMDIQMPVMDGMSATRELKKMYGDNLPPIVAMTAFSMEDDKKLFLKVGMDEYLSKPITPVKLIKKLRQIFDNKAELEIEEELSPEETQIIDQGVVDQLRALGGDEMLDDMFQDFIGETDLALETCKAAVKKRDYIQILSILHSIKGTSATIGIQRLSEAARVLESELKGKKYKELESGFTHLIGSYDEFKKHLAQKEKK